MHPLTRRQQVLTQLALALVAAFVLLPVWSLFLLALDGSIAYLPQQFNALPAKPTLSVFADVWTKPSQGLSFLVLLRNSLIVSGGAALLSLSLGTGMAWAFARFRFPGRRAGLVALLLGAMLPPVALMTPLYVLLSAAHLRTTQLGLLLVYAGFSMPFCVWLMRGAFRVVPRELDEAAVMEGAGSWAIFRHIALPLALPSILVAGLLAFLVGYSEFAIGWLFVDRADLVTLAMAVSGTGVGLQGGQWARMAALSILMSLPVVALFLALQGRLFGAFAASLEDE